MNRVGSTVPLDCPYTRNAGQTEPKLVWYAYKNDRKYKIFVYDFNTGYGAPVSGAFWRVLPRR